MKTSMVTLLYCIKTLGKQNAQLKFLYKEREQLLRPALKKNIITRQELLNAQDNSGKTAYFFGQIPLLRPIESERK